MDADETEARLRALMDTIPIEPTFPMKLLCALKRLLKTNR